MTAASTGFFVRLVQESLQQNNTKQWHSITKK